MLCFGHRGAMGYAPENTLKSISVALSLGTPWIEIDVHHVDGRLMVFHDDRLERTTNGSGYLRDRTFGYLRTLDAGEGQKIPTLEEVFDLVSNRAGINIELKGPETAAPVASFVRQRYRRSSDFARLLVSSFDHRQIVHIKKLEPRILTGSLIGEVPPATAGFADKLAAYSVHPNAIGVSAPFVADAHRRGLKVFAYTVNRPADIHRMDTLGVDGLFSDYPDRVLSYLETRPRHGSDRRHLGGWLT